MAQIIIEEKIDYSGNKSRLSIAKNKKGGFSIEVTKVDEIRSYLRTVAFFDFDKAGEKLILEYLNKSFEDTIVR